MFYEAKRPSCQKWRPSGPKWEPSFFKKRSASAAPGARGNQSNTEECQRSVQGVFKECPRSVQGVQCWSVVARKRQSLRTASCKLMILHASGPEVRRIIGKGTGEPLLRPLPRNGHVPKKSGPAGPREPRPAGRRPRWPAGPDFLARAGSGEGSGFGVGFDFWSGGV